MTEATVGVESWIMPREIENPREVRRGPVALQLLLTRSNPTKKAGAVNVPLPRAGKSDCCQLAIDGRLRSWQQGLRPHGSYD
jgi:hypothetical protein